MDVNWFSMDSLGIYQHFYEYWVFDLGEKKCEVCKIMCCYVGLNYLVVDDFLWICDSMCL